MLVWVTRVLGLSYLIRILLRVFGSERADLLEDAIMGAVAVLIVTDHPEFKNIDHGSISRIGIDYGRAFKL